MPKLVAASCTALALTLALPACGDEDAPEAGYEEEGEEGLSEEEREIAERAEAAEEVSEADRVAFYQLATAAGILRARAASELEGKPPPPDTSDPELRAAADRVSKLDPRDPGLRRLAAEFEPELRAASALGRAEARRALRAAEDANEALDRYEHREPIIGVFNPD